MKQKLFILAAAVAALASCSNEEIASVEQSQAKTSANAITFVPMVNGITRGMSTDASVYDVTISDLRNQGFHVNAMNAGTTTPYFSNAIFFYDGENYTSMTPYYWPWSGSLDFYAYYYYDQYEDETGDQLTVTNYKTFTVTPYHAANTDDQPYLASNQIDLVYAATKNKSKNSGDIALNFRHTGSKIRCEVKNSSTAYKFTVCAWKVGYVSPSGTFTFADTNTDGNNNGSGTTLTAAQWSGQATASIATQYASYPSSGTIAAKSADEEHITPLSGEMLLVPQTLTAATGYASSSVNADLNGAFIAVQIKIQDASNDDYIIGSSAADGYVWAIWPISGSWEPGKQYIYTIDLAGGGYKEKNDNTGGTALVPYLRGPQITFATVTVDDWTTDPQAVSN